MKRSTRFLQTAALAVLVKGCAHVAFDHDMRQRYQLTPETLYAIQFYSSGPIVLERRVERRRGEAAENRQLMLRETELIRRVVIPEGTPGVVKAVHDDRLEIEFEPHASLTFGSTERHRKKLGGLYYLMANRWENGRGMLKYGDQVFVTQPGAGAVHLRVKARDIRQTRIVRKTVRGLLATSPRVWLADPPLTEAEKAAERPESNVETEGANAVASAPTPEPRKTDSDRTADPGAQTIPVEGESGIK